MYVVLEGLGAMLKINPSNDSTIDSVAVGTGSRHVSVSADGSRISRFAIRYAAAAWRKHRKPADIGRRCAEIAVVDGPSMTLQTVNRAPPQ
jgi:hypothetical protein